MEAILMMLPLIPRSTIILAASRATINSPVRLTSTTFRNSSTVTSKEDLWSPIAALLNTISSEPQRSKIWAYAAFTWSSTETSVTIDTASPPSFLIRLTVSSAPERHKTATFAPALASPWATTFPVPLAPPVTTATFPFNPNKSSRYMKNSPPNDNLRRLFKTGLFPIIEILQIH